MKNKKKPLLLVLALVLCLGTFSCKPQSTIAANEITLNPESTLRTKNYEGKKILIGIPERTTFRELLGMVTSSGNINISKGDMTIGLDDNVTTLYPIGQKTTSIVLDVSYVLAKRKFYNMMGEKLTGLGIKEIEFISTSLGQAMKCEPKQKNKPFALIDVGHITTNVSVYKGEGLALMSSFSMGGGHISSDLMQLLNLSFKNAELIKRKVILTIENNKNEHYEVCSKGSLIKAPINMTNQIVKSRIEMMAKVIKNILTMNDTFKDIDIYLTGDGLSNFKGARNILKDITGFNVYEYKIPFDSSTGKYQTSKMGLAELANVAI